MKKCNYCLGTGKLYWYGDILGASVARCRECLGTGNTKKHSLVRGSVKTQGFTTYGKSLPKQGKSYSRIIIHKTSINDIIFHPSMILMRDVLGSRKNARNHAKTKVT